MSSPVPWMPQEVAHVLDALTVGEIDVEGRLVDASNVVLLGHLDLDDVSTRVIYKPVRGERPLWDFPSGTLARREASAFTLSAAGGWDLVPPTVLREGPLGSGSVQLWIDAVEGGSRTLVDVVTPEALEPGWMPVLEAQLSDGTAVVLAHADRPELASAAVFDVVINNADRKGSHLVVDRSGSLWGFDHGLCAHTEPKLRTVLWGWAGEPLPAADLDRLEKLSGSLSNPGDPLPRALEALLEPAEVDALRGRIANLLRTGLFPEPNGRGPAVPWPPL
ncbi:MAG: SCO1664 family protein [Actinomycetota bacterium]